MGFKISDSDLAYGASLVNYKVNAINRISQDLIGTMQILAATGIQSDKFNSAIQTEQAELISVVQKITDAISPTISNTDTFISNLDKDDADFD